jgi:hypothetical protein
MNTLDKKLKQVNNLPRVTPSMKQIIRPSLLFFVLMNASHLPQPRKKSAASQ